jgi:hypothetical protein
VVFEKLKKLYVWTHCTFVYPIRRMHPFQKWVREYRKILVNVLELGGRIGDSCNVSAAYANRLKHFFCHVSPSLRARLRLWLALFLKECVVPS